MMHLAQTEQQGDERQPQDEERQAFLHPPGLGVSEDNSGQEKRHGRPYVAWVGARAWAWRWRCYARLVVEIAMAIAIVGLLVVLALAPSARPAEQGEMLQTRRSPVPKLPRKIYRFAENQTYLREDMFATELDTLHTLHNWIELSSASRGYVVIDDYESYELPEPYTVPVNHTSSGPGFMVSVFHQLHCLSYLVQHYQAGYSGADLAQEVAHHSAHCFDYLRQSIMCAADTSLEGRTEDGPGWGSEHECVDYEALLAWANGHAALKWHLVPLEGVL